MFFNSGSFFNLKQQNLGRTNQTVPVPSSAYDAIISSIALQYETLICCSFCSSWHHELEWASKKLERLDASMTMRLPLAVQAVRRLFSSLSIEIHNGVFKHFGAQLTNLSVN
ncbi:hypothetical protein V6N13_085228 [Hibiscus sabdariffa]